MFGTENILQVFSIKRVRRAFGPTGEDVQEARARDFQRNSTDLAPKSGPGTGLELCAS